MSVRSSFELNSGQFELVGEAVKWHHDSNSQIYTYSGFAGTGKTTVLPSIIKNTGLAYNEILFLAYTGKAASILCQKGFNAYTMHSSLFEVKDVPKLINGEPIIRNGRKILTPTFVPKESIDPHIKLIVIDEWSMVDEYMDSVLQKFGIPILASGDEDQLPPIFGISPYASRVQYRLTEIMRQAKDNGIVILATMIRTGQELPKIYYNIYNDAYILDKKLLTGEHLLKADMILCSKNKTRELFNNKIRDLHGSHGALPNPGDKLICRKNTRQYRLEGIPLINGTIGTCANPIQRSLCDFKNNIYTVDFQPDYCSYDYYDNLKCDLGFLTQPCGDKDMDRFNPGVKLEYAEAITVHLSQGSQYNTVVYYDEPIGDYQFMKKLRYTAVTRAVNKFYMFI